MRKKLLVLCLMIWCITPLMGSDIVVTQREDSTSGKISKDKENRIYFSFKSEEGKRNTLLFWNDISFFKRDFYASPIVGKAGQKVYEANFNRVNLVVRGGWSYRLAKIYDGVSSNAKEHIKGLKSGYHIGADVSYSISEEVGLGLKYSFARFQNTSFGTLQDIISLNYIGPAVYVKQLSGNEKFCFSLDASIGYLGYKNKGFIRRPFTLNGGTLGYSIGAGVDFKLARNLWFGAGLSLNLGALQKVNFKGNGYDEKLKLEETESLTRIDLSGGFRWNI